jgi:hypothetical protein
VAHYSTVMSELLHLIPRHRFETLVKTHDTDSYVKKFDCWNQLTTLLYAQASGKDSLRDIEQSLRLNNGRCYHLGLPSVKRSTLADANKTRDYRIFEGLFYKILEKCKDLTPKHRFRFKNPLYSLDATVIDLCLSSFPWAKFRKTKGALKLHYQLDHSGEIPSFLVITDGKVHDIKAARNSFTLSPDSIYCFDRGYVDYGFFREIQEAKSTFVTRAKDNMDYRVTGQHAESNKKSVLSDEIIELTGFYSHKDHPGKLRLVTFYDTEHDRIFRFLTNNFDLAAITIAEIYKSRWYIESFFKWIKQNLKIKTFLGSSKNAVLTQIWVAMIYFLILAYVRYQTRYKPSLFYLHRAIRETLLSRCSIFDLLRATKETIPKLREREVQLEFL